MGWRVRAIAGRRGGSGKERTGRGHVAVRAGGGGRRWATLDGVQDAIEGGLQADHLTLHNLDLCWLGSIDGWRGTHHILVLEASKTSGGESTS